MDPDELLPDAPKRRITEPGFDEASGSHLEAEQVIGRYVIQHFLAQGGMGVVYVARDPELGRRVALKLVRTKGGADGTMRQRLLREAQALAQLSHPNVISVFDVGVHEDGVFIAMELVDGISLRTYLSQPHSWRDKVKILISAGRGLAAAHAAGIVHRDFKPENVIIGNDGRVCVLDFGLARAASDNVPTEPSRQATAGEAVAAMATQDLIPTVTLVPATLEGTSRSALEAHLTGLGTVVGTPPYMSPEHHRGDAVTPASDQFSFCVAAWEALYGQRPYSGQADGLRAAKERFRVEAPPRGARVPARVRRLLLRGLSPSPAARHASMPALLSALGGALSAPKRVAIAAGVALGVGAIVVALTTRASPPSLCSVANAEQSFGDAWAAAQRGHLAAAFQRSARATAAETARRAADALDRYRGEWLSMHVASCQATHERGEQSAALLDLRTQCLATRREAARALAAQLLRASDGEVVDRAVQAALGLPSLAGCADTAALSAAVPLPRQDRARSEVAALQSRLAEVRALSATGQYTAALPGAREVVAKARPLGYPPLLAEALHTLASTEDDLGQNEESMRSAREGALAAGSARDDALIAQALVDVMWAYGQQAKYDEALSLSVALEATLARGEAPAGSVAAALDATRGASASPVTAAASPVRLDDERAVYLGTKGRILSAQGRYVEAASALEESLAIRAAKHGSEHWRLAAALNSLGEVLRATGRYDEALARFQRAREITARALGDEHPNVGAIVNNIGAVYERQQKYDESKEMYELSLRIDEATFGSEHPRVAISLMNLGALLDGRGQPQAAVPFYTRALAIQRRASGDAHPEVAMVLHNLGLAELHLGQPDVALTRFRESLGILAGALPADHINLSMPMLGIGDALLEQRRPAEALAQYQQALELQSKVYPPDSVDLAYALQGIARANLAAGRTAAALVAAERLVAVYAKDGGDPDNRALADYVLAQAMWLAGKDRTRAKELVRAARGVLAASRDREMAAVQQSLREMAAWLAARGG